jgi:hypothetical protein
MTSMGVPIEEARNRSATAILVWGVLIGVLQTFSPVAFWWLDQDVVWALSVVAIAFVYVGFAVADGRPRIIAIESVVAMGFVVLACVAIAASPWLVVAGLVGHGLKDLWQHRSHFVANTRWWPPFCLVVDLVAAASVAVLLIVGVDLSS